MSPPPTEAATSTITQRPPTSAPAPVYQTLDTALPAWALGLSLSWMGFALVYAVGILVSQVFSSSGDSGKKSRRRDGCAHGDVEDGVAVKGSGRRGGEGQVGVERGVLWRRRKAGAKGRGLSVDTGRARGEGKGLGIELREHALGGMAHGSESRKERLKVATAPLPIVRATAADPSHDVGAAKSHTNTEITRPQSKGNGKNDASEPYCNRRASPYLDANEQADAQETKGWLGAANRATYWIADSLANVFYDEVVEAEEGLLLPRKESEREGSRHKGSD